MGDLSLWPFECIKALEPFVKTHLGQIDLLPKRVDLDRRTHLLFKAYLFLTCALISSIACTRCNDFKPLIPST
jgi:hypothetical protein